MATSTSSHSPKAPLAARMLRVRRSPPLQLSHQDAEELRARELDAIPRQGGEKVSSVEAFCTKLDDVVLYIHALRETQHDEGRSDWWHMADLLDDLADLRAAMHGDSWSGAVAKLVPVNGVVDPAVEPRGWRRKLRKTNSMRLKTSNCAQGVRSIPPRCTWIA